MDQSYQTLKENGWKHSSYQGDMLAATEINLFLMTIKRKLTNNFRMTYRSDRTGDT